jgi:hypothetical protein
MQNLYNPDGYPPALRSRLKKMPPLALEIANRWMLGWPERVQALIQAGEFLPALMAQEQEERRVLASETATHLARHEILQEWGLSLEPPQTSTSQEKTSGPGA